MVLLIWTTGYCIHYGAKMAAEVHVRLVFDCDTAAPVLPRGLGVGMPTKPTSAD